MYFENKELIQNTLLPYFCEAEPLKLINKKFNELNYEKYNTHIQPHGIVQTYFSDCKNDNLSEQKTYRNGKLNGIYEIWRSSSRLYKRKNYKNGKEHGLEKTWYTNGQLWSMYNFKYGKLHGSCESYHSNGQLLLKYNYKNGKLDGLYEQWNENGVLRIQETYKKGQLKTRQI